MSTNYHSAIATGAAANAATFNDPLGDLDAAIAAEAVARAAAVDVVDDRVSTIIASSGTSSTEVVDSRGGYTALSDNLGDKYFRSDVLLVDAAFEGLSAAGRFQTIGAALAACTGGETIIVAPGIYTENVEIADDNVKLIGSGMPSYDSGTGRLVNGTIVRGYIDCNSHEGITVANLGVDLYGVNSVGALIPSQVTNVDLWQTFRDLVLLGNGNAALAHAIESNGGGHITFDNIYMRDWYHGLAILGNFVNASNIDCYSCSGTSIVVKSKTGSGNAHHVNISNVNMDGGTASYLVRAGPILIQSNDNSYSTKFVNVTNVTCRNAVNGVIQIDRLGDLGTITDCNFSNIISTGDLGIADIGDFNPEHGQRITFSNCHSVSRVSGYAFKIGGTGDADGIFVHGAVADGSGSGTVADPGLVFDVMEMNGLRYGVNRIGVTLADDIATSITPPAASGAFTISCGNDVGIYGLISYRAASSPFCATTGAGSDLNTTTGALANAGGTDVKYTVSAHTNGKIYLSNRKGASRTVILTFFT